MTSVRPCVVVVSGLNGTGKTTLASHLRSHLSALDTMSISEAVAAGASVVVEGVFADEFQRSLIAEAARANARLVTVECECTHEAVHKQRVVERWQRGDSPVTWEMVVANKAEYRKQASPDYRADSVQAIEAHVTAVVALLEAKDALGGSEPKT